MSQSAKPTNDSKNTTNKAVIIIIVILAVVVIALVAVVAFLLGRGNGNKVNDNNNSGNGTEQRQVANTESVRLVVDEESASTVMDEMRKEVEEGMFQCKMSMKWTFADGKSESKDAYVANSENNSHPIYFDVYLKDTNELIYSSPVLPVGTDLKDIKLDKELPAGDYKATVMYTLIKDVESQETISQAGFVISIKVLN